jgi:long-subunit acyl-CoA synthetase (AMP-forming)
VLVLQALKPHIFVSVPRLWNRIYDRVMATMREANPIKRRMFETAFAYKRAALEAGADKWPEWQTSWPVPGPAFGPEPGAGRRAAYV